MNYSVEYTEDGINCVEQFATIEAAEERLNEVKKIDSEARITV